jgi:hypothetical protein
MEKPVLDTGNSLDNKVLCSNRSRFVKTADIDASCKWYAERLRTEYRCKKLQARMPNSTLETLPNFDSATKEAFTARDNSMGNSGGTTLVTISTQSSNSFDFFKFLSIPGFTQLLDILVAPKKSSPLTQTYQLAAIAKISKNPMNRNDSKLFAETRSVEKIMVRTSCPWAVPNPVRKTTPRQPPSGVLPSKDGRIRGITPFRDPHTTITPLEEFCTAKQHGISVLTICIELLTGLQEFYRFFQQWS